TAVAWASAIANEEGPTSLLLSRQGTPFLGPRPAETLADIARGAYVLQDAAEPRAVLIATGSEVGVARDAAGLLEAEGLPVRVVSMPSTTVFDRQDPAYRQAVLPDGVPRIAVEAGV